MLIEIINCECVIVVFGMECYDFITSPMHWVATHHEVVVLHPKNELKSDHQRIIHCVNHLTKVIHLIIGE